MSATEEACKEMQKQILQLQAKISEQHIQIQQLTKERDKAANQIAEWRTTSALIPRTSTSTPGKDATKKPTQEPPNKKRSADCLNTSSESESTGNMETSPTVPKNKPPPKITVSDITDYTKFCEEVTTALGEGNVTYRAISNCNALIAAKTDQHFRKLIELLKHHNAKYHTYTLKAERPYRVVVRGLHPNIDIDLIRHDLENLGHVPTNIVNIKKTIKRRDQNGKITNREVKVYPLFYVDLMPKENNKIGLRNYPLRLPPGKGRTTAQDHYHSTMQTVPEVEPH